MEKVERQSAGTFFNFVAVFYTVYFPKNIYELAELSSVIPIY